MPGSLPSHVIVVLVGPGQREVNRLRDLVDSCERFDPPRHYILVDDEIGRPPPSLPLDGNRVTWLRNPRRGRGNGWSSGAACGIITGFNAAAAIPGATFVLKLDPDSLIIGPFADKIASFFRAHPHVGACGCYKHFPNRERDLPEDLYCGPAIKKMSRLVSPWRRTMLGRWPFLQGPWLASCRRVRRIIHSALHHGYIGGEHVQGGGYAIEASALREVKDRGWLEHPRHWLWTPLGEDVVMSLLISAAGFKLADQNAPGEPFGVAYRELPFPPEELIQKQYSIIHPVKGSQEAELRSFFQQHRMVPS